MRPYKDPDEFIKNLGKEAFQERIDQAENSFYFEIRILSEQYDQSDPEQRTKVPPGDCTEAVWNSRKIWKEKLSAGNCGKIYDPSGRSAQNER